MDEQLKENLVRQFREYLDGEFTKEPTEETVDLMSLFKELAGLKNEVRRESRQLKGALDDFREAFTSLDARQQEMTMLLHKRELEGKSVEPDATISGLIDLHDRICAGLDRELPQSTLFERITGCSRTRRWLQSHMEGQKSILNRVLDLLARENVTPVKSLGEQFNPQVMQAVGFEANKHQDEGRVLAEHRNGFQQGDKTLRPAEVIVNKRGTTV